MTPQELAGYLKKEFEDNGLNVTSWGVQIGISLPLDGVVVISFKDKETNYFRVGPDNMWQWLSNDGWVGYTKFYK